MKLFPYPSPNSASAILFNCGEGRFIGDARGGRMADVEAELLRSIFGFVTDLHIFRPSANASVDARAILPGSLGCRDGSGPAGVPGVRVTGSEICGFAAG